MSNNGNRNVTEAESRHVAETSRETQWRKPSFMKDLFLGSFRFGYVYPFPGAGEPDRPEYTAFSERLKTYLLDHIDPLEIDATGEFPPDVIERLAELGALGMNIPSEYEGQGFTKTEYCKTMELSGSYEGSLMGFLSPHQSVGVPECLKLFGTEAQKREYLPRCASGEISAFALTELDVGSDPARLSTTLEATPDGKGYLLDGLKLWCTNGTVAKLLVVMARHKESGKISAVVVEMQWAGVEVEHRCRFMGLSALQNAVIRFQKVYVPKDNLIGKEGMGLRIALTALNTGRLSVPYGMMGCAKKCLEVARIWAAQRKQWGRPIGEHEAIAHKITRIAATTFAMESCVQLACRLADAGNLDIRLESAAAKEWNTSRAWEIIDDTMQIRGGRGYEKETSLRARGEEPMPVERLMRDQRVARIFEGASEIMHLIMAREAVDRHLEAAGALVDSGKSLGAKLAAVPGALSFYARWYPARWVGLRGCLGYGQFGILSGHLRFIDRASRRLARQAFHGMLLHQAGLERKQAFLFRWVDIAMELYAMSAVVSRAATLKELGATEAESAVSLADVFCRAARRKVKRLFHELWHNDDDLNTRTAADVLAGRFAWLESGIISLAEAEKADQARMRAEGGGAGHVTKESSEAVLR